MSAGPLLEGWPGLGAESLLLALDYDGTLVPIVERPEEARADGPLLDLLVSLLQEDGLHLVLLSGRPVGTLEAWLPLPELTLVGIHGAEWRPAGAAETRPFLAPIESRTAARQAAASLEEALGAQPGSQVEAKPYGVAAHYRRVPAERREAWRKSFAAAAAPHCPPFEIHEGKCVCELRWPGVDKGRALEELRRRDEGREMPVLALGDDRTDEATFAALGPGDLGLHVGPGPTGASACLPNTDAARTLLGRLPALRRRARSES